MSESLDELRERVEFHAKVAKLQKAILPAAVQSIDQFTDEILSALEEQEEGR